MSNLLIGAGVGIGLTTIWLSTQPLIVAYEDGYIHFNDDFTEVCLQEVPSEELSPDAFCVGLSRD